MHRLPWHYWQLLSEYLRPYWLRMTLLALLIFAGTGLQLAAPQFLRQFIDGALEQDELAALYTAAFLFLVLGISGNVVIGMASYVGRDIGWLATNKLRSDLTIHMLGLDMSFHNAHTPGELVERVDGDVERLANFFSQLTVLLIGGIVMVLGIVAITWVEDWRFGLLATGYAVYSLTVRARLTRLIVPFWHDESQTRAEFYGFVGERVSGLKDIHANGATQYMMRRYHEVMRSRFWSRFKALAVTRILWGMSSSSGSLFWLGALGIGVYLFRSEAITIGTVFLMHHYFGMLIDPITRILREVEDLQQASVSIERVNELFETRPAIADDGVSTIRPGMVPIEFSNVSFAYRPDVEVLDNVSFRVEPGSTLGLLGRTGSGKTTIARLLLRFYDPVQGTVLLGDVDPRQTSLAELRHRVGLVTQEVQLFRATVRENIALFDEDVSDDKIVEHLDLLGLGDWYRALPNGLDTVLATGGGNLSAGQAQLLAFTRVFLKDPDVVVMDEASSHLDPATERLLGSAMDKLLSDRTAVIIAHRLSTIQRVDQIMIIDGGRILEYGPRTELSNDPTSRFSGLLKTGMEEVLA